MENFIKFVEEIKKRKDFNEITACCFWFYMLKDFIIKYQINESYRLYPKTLNWLYIVLIFISDVDMKESMINFLNQQNLQKAQEILQKLYNSEWSNTIKEFVEIISKNKIF